MLVGVLQRVSLLLVTYSARTGLLISSSTATASATATAAVAVATTASASLLPFICCNCLGNGWNSIVVVDIGVDIDWVARRVVSSSSPSYTAAVSAVE